MAASFAMAVFGSVLIHPVSAQCPQPTAKIGENAGDHFGERVAITGDLDGDGYDDWVVGAPFYDPTVSNRGKVYVYSGRTGALLHSITGAFSGARLGWAVAAAGDLNGDDRADFMVSRVDSALVLAISGGTWDTLFLYYDPLFSTDNFGTSLAPAGDVNNDGYDDILIGADGYDTAGVDRGKVYVFYGRDTSLNFAIPRDNANMTFVGEGASDFFGYAVAGRVDIDGDGRDDLIIGAPEFNVDSGYVQVRSGATGALLYRIGGVETLDQFGRTVVGVPDFTGDSLAEFAVGAPLHGAASTGEVRVFSGATGTVHTIITSATPSMRLGFGLALAGDVDEDGSPDLIAGSLAEQVFVYSAADASLIAAYTNPTTDPFFGSTVAGSGDLNADGLWDLVVGTQNDDAGGEDAGSAQIYLLGDFDRDGFENACDNCPAVANPGQEDLNFNGIGDACEVGDTLTIYLFSPVHMVVTDPASDSIGLTFNTIGNGSSYDSLTDFNQDAKVDDIVTIPMPLVGDYKVRIIRDDGVPDSAKFTLSIRINGNQLLEDDAYQNVTVDQLGTTVPDTYVWTAAATLPGDANADGVTTAADIIYLVNYVFKGGPNAVVPGHGDVNCDGVVTSADIITLVSYVFKSGLPPCSKSAG